MRIIKPGLLDTVQDAGRYGYQHLGINPGGAMDSIAMRIANALVGNMANEAVLEMHFPAAEMVFEATVLIALAGADFSASIDHKEVPLHHPVLVKQGAALKFIQKKKGSCVYLSVEGGFETMQWLGSSSTHLQVGAGGLEGRQLQKNDRLVLKKESNYLFAENHSFFEVLPWQAKVADFYSDGKIRCVAGNEFDLLNDASKKTLLATPFTISSSSNRMGYRLQGADLQTTVVKEMLSTAVTKGTIQLLPNGQLIVLMADHQTTGGYPRVGHIISTDISSLAQCGVGQTFHLQMITIEEAEYSTRTQEMNLQQLINACNFRLQQYLAL